MTLHQAQLLTAHRDRISRMGGTGYLLPPLPPVEVSPPRPARWGSIVATLLLIAITAAVSVAGR